MRKNLKASLLLLSTVSLFSSGPLFSKEDGLNCSAGLNKISEKTRKKIQKIQESGRPIMIVTDTSMKMTNGVVTVLKEMTAELDNLKVKYSFIEQDDVPGFTFKSEKAQGTGVRYLSHKNLKSIIQKENPVAIHIVTEGTIGESVRLFANQNNIPISSFYHTEWPMFFKDMFNVPVALGEKFVTRFHNTVDTVMSATNGMRKSLEAMGIKKEKLKIRAHGVKLDQYYPRNKADFLPEVKAIFDNNEGPYSLFVGRISVEKSIQDFLDVDIKGTKIIVGNGPLYETFIKEQKSGKHQNVIFTGRQSGESLAQFFSGADVFVFPSRTDTFGLVQLEAMASGTPVAAYPVKGPIDVVTKKTGALNENLKLAIEEALTKDPKDARAYAETYSWKNTAIQFIENVHEIPEIKIKNLHAKMPMYQKIPLIVTASGTVYAIVYYIGDDNTQK